MTDETPPIVDDDASYQAALSRFDASVCDAIAVSQGTSGRLPAMNVSYASYVFTRMCGAGISLIRAAPRSRWVHANFDDWQFGAVAGHARSLLDGLLLFSYLIEPAKSEAEFQARINVMHLNDCTRRIDLHTNLGHTDDLEGFEKQREELRGRLKGNEYFTALPDATQKNCLNGRYLMIESRDEMLARVGFEKGQFDALYDLYSQHMHILPLSFYRMEANGRGTGVENPTDRAYIAEALRIGASILVVATDKMVGEFPDVAGVRNGVKSTFSPGPKENVPAPKRENPKNPEPIPAFKESSLARAIRKGLGR